MHATVVRGYAFLGVGDLDAAISTGRDAVRLSESLGETWERGIAYQLLAGASLGRGDLDDAAISAKESVRLERDLDDRIGIAHTIALFAAIEMQRDRPQRTATLLGGSEAIFQSIPSSLMEPFRRTEPAGSGRSAPRDRRSCIRGGLRARAGDDARRGGRLRSRGRGRAAAPDRD